MDNRIFNINGQDKGLFYEALKLAFLQSGYEKASGCRFDSIKGMILYWGIGRDQQINPFITPLGPENVANLLWEWLQSDQAKTVQCSAWDSDTDQDGHNELGWRIYCEEWGNIGSEIYTFLAVKPAYLWFGK